MSGFDTETVPSCEPHATSTRTSSALCLHTSQFRASKSSSDCQSCRMSRPPTRDAAEPCYVLTLRDELGPKYHDSSIYPCSHAGCGSIVTDLYRFCLHIYNCKRLKYDCLLQNGFSFAASFFSHVHFSFVLVVCDRFVLISLIPFLQYPFLPRWCPGAA